MANTVPWLVAQLLLLACVSFAERHWKPRDLPGEHKVNAMGEIYHGGRGKPGGWVSFHEEPLAPPRVNYISGIEDTLKIYVHEPEFLVKTWEQGLRHFQNEDPSGNYSYWNGEDRGTSQHCLDYWLYRLLKESPNRVDNPEAADVYYVPASFVLTPSQKVATRLWTWLNSDPVYKKYPARHVMLFPTFHAKNAIRKGWNRKYSNRGSISVVLEEEHWVPSNQPFIAVPYVAHNYLPRTNASGEIPAIDALVRSITFYGRWTNRWGSPRTALSQLPWSRVGGRVVSGTFEIAQTAAEYEEGLRSYTQELLRARFCLIPRGDTPSSRRLYDAVLAGCLPVIVSDSWNQSLPFRHTIPWEDFTFRVREQSREFKMEPFQRILDTPLPVLRRMQSTMMQYAPYLTYGDPAGDGDTSVSKLREAFLREVAEYIAPKDWSSQ